MADPKGFLKTSRQTPPRRPVDVRIQDWKEVYQDFGNGQLEQQASSLQAEQSQQLPASQVDSAWIRTSALHCSSTTTSSK